MAPPKGTTHRYAKIDWDVSRKPPSSLIEEWGIKQTILRGNVKRLLFWLGKLNVTFFLPKRASVLYLTSSSLETRIVGYSFEPSDLPPVLLWPFLHLIPYLVLVEFSQIFSVGPPHIGHLKSFNYFHPNQKRLLRKSQEWICCRCVFQNFCLHN